MLSIKSNHSVLVRFSTGPLTSAFSVAYQLQAVPNVVSETLPSPHPTNTFPLITPCSSAIHFAKLLQGQQTRFQSWGRSPNSHNPRPACLACVLPDIEATAGARRNATCPQTILFGIVQETRICVRIPKNRNLLLRRRVRRAQEKDQLLRMAGSA